ncbi:MAG: antibiotic biosynthesis monooxygenase [Bacillota bacterium]|nr:antibiotic biosynthesis monooxygenase [Bacillota bacterium]
MKVYMTIGTFDYLKELRKKYQNEKMLLMLNQDDALLLHETIGETVFKEPRSYEVFDSLGEMRAGEFVVMNNIPVSDEGRPLFEHRFKNRPKTIENEPGFVAIRVLRPLLSNTYVILTGWKDENSFLQWQHSKAFTSSHEGKKDEFNSQPKIFTSTSYLTKFQISD